MLTVFRFSKIPYGKKKFVTFWPCQNCIKLKMAVFHEKSYFFTFLKVYILILHNLLRVWNNSKRKMIIFGIDSEKMKEIDWKLLEKKENENWLSSFCVRLTCARFSPLTSFFRLFCSGKKPQGTPKTYIS